MIAAMGKTGAAMQHKPVTACSDVPKLNYEAKRFAPPSYVNFQRPPDLPLSSSLRSGLVVLGFGSR